MNCDRNCFKCKFKDCNNSIITIEDYNLSQSLDKEVLREEIPIDVLNRRKHSLNWYHKNRDSELERQKRYREEHREELREKAKQYHIEHRDEDNQRHLANYYSNHEENKKKNREAKRKRYQANKEYYRQKQREYRQRVKERSKQSDTDCSK